ncbi:MAG TPA: type II toxin-antitoxin system RelE/ParE family toxin [Candidatus Acidoferrum sp.]|nr:type II toxin-antitoxin system RelE/ParE family toxin [Candidatus Acidoferrum sp.]
MRYFKTVLITPKDVLAYQAREGRIPFNEWLDDVGDQKAVARILARLARVRQGNLGDCKGVGEGVAELRVDYGPGYRVYFGQKGQTLVILLCGGDKRTQERDIQRAKQFWQDYNERD